MLKLSARQPVWHDVIPGVRVQFAPITPSAWRAGQRAARAAYAEIAEIADDDMEGLAALSLKLMQIGVIAWEGVGDVDGQPIKPTPETIALLLDEPGVFEIFHAAYVAPYLTEVAQKNASSAGLNGTGPAATQADAIANSRAGGKRAAKPVRTMSTNRKQTARKTSGI